MQKLLRALQHIIIAVGRIRCCQRAHHQGSSVSDQDNYDTSNCCWYLDIRWIMGPAMVISPDLLMFKRVQIGCFNLCQNLDYDDARLLSAEFPKRYSAKRRDQLIHEVIHLIRWLYLRMLRKDLCQLKERLEIGSRRAAKTGFVQG